MPASRRKQVNGLLPPANASTSQEPVVAVQVTDHEQGQTVVGLRKPGQHGYIYVPEAEGPKGQQQ